jgi:hypothetical protein
MLKFNTIAFASTNISPILEQKNFKQKISESDTGSVRNKPRNDTRSRIETFAF